jgi:hypothetical protein
VAAILVALSRGPITDVRIAAAEEDLAPAALSPSEDGDILPEEVEPGGQRKTEALLVAPPAPYVRPANKLKKETPMKDIMGMMGKIKDMQAKMEACRKKLAERWNAKAWPVAAWFP